MKTITRILVPTDFSEAALNAMRYALWFADNHGAGIHVLHVVFPGTGELDVPVISASETKHRVEGAEQAIEAFIASSKASLTSIRPLKNDVAVSSEIRIGAPVTELKTALDTLSTDLIIVGTRSSHSTLDEIFGSVATGIVNRADVPVIVVPEQARDLRLNACCYATQLDESDPFFIWRTRSLFMPFNPIIHVVHVDPPDRTTGDISLQELEEMMAGRLSQKAIAYHKVEGKNIVEELHAFAEEREVDMIVMRTTQRNILQRLSHESLTRRMSLQARLPLCILKGSAS